ncbi:MAG: cyclic-di-AMP receptor [Oscillospiraceae bacterium]|nr:cyclic-di-AMP receptor [Oscillospiraceae bacterium]
MKLVIAIINNDDCPTVLSEITKAGFSATKLSTSGGFLRAGNSTLLIGVEEDKVDSLIEIIGKFSCKRKQIVQASTTFNAEFFTSVPVEVNVGGATVFVVDVDKFVKL